MSREAPFAGSLWKSLILSHQLWLNYKSPNHRSCRVRRFENLPVVSHYRFYEKVIKVKDDVAAILFRSRMFSLLHWLWMRTLCSQGMHKGAAALLWGEPAASRRDSVFCWRAACFRRGGNHPAPACPWGKRERGIRFLAAAGQFLSQARIRFWNISQTPPLCAALLSAL